jgi:hypothetical protein
METGTLNVQFEFFLGGADVKPVEFQVPSQHLVAKLIPGSIVRIDVTVEKTEKAEAESVARRFADELFHRILLRHGDKIDRAWAPREGHKNFKGDAGHLSVAFPMAVAVGAEPEPTVVLDLEDVAKEVEMRVVASQLPTSAQLYTAIDMYLIGLEAENKVVRYLVLYSAMALASIFRSHRGNQQSIDALLLGEEPSIPCSPSPRSPQLTETLYTRLRNELIHAEERGSDPAAAIANIEKHTRGFQSIVARVLAKR